MLGLGNNNAVMGRELVSVAKNAGAAPGASGLDASVEGEGFGAANQKILFRNNK